MTTAPANPAGYIGYLYQFSPFKNDWLVAKPQMENFFVLNKIKDADTKRALFLNSLDESGYRLMQNLTVPGTPEAQTYDTLIGFFRRSPSAPGVDFLYAQPFLQRDQRARRESGRLARQNSFPSWPV
ncbi:unnamed protein product [Nesidiocoris tenuis]|uniref:Uncharacterized protein n=1 Tax=Nesidiocoris tenuis TaxID=355587 RepID=A0A6H5HR68_9HEMI|nr:unnamed protein product [Nesidiocoris tenuis]